MKDYSKTLTDRLSSKVGLGNNGRLKSRKKKTKIKDEIVKKKLRERWGRNKDISLLKELDLWFESWD